MCWERGLNNASKCTLDAELAQTARRNVGKNFHPIAWELQMLHQFRTTTPSRYENNPWVHFTELHQSSKRSAIVTQSKFKKSLCTLLTRKNRFCEETKRIQSSSVRPLLLPLTSAREEEVWISGMIETLLVQRRRLDYLCRCLEKLSGQVRQSALWWFKICLRRHHVRRTHYWWLRSDHQ